MPAAGNQAADFVGHAPAQRRVAAAESHHHGLRILAQEPEDPLFETLLHVTDLELHSAAQAASGVTAAMAVTGP